MQKCREIIRPVRAVLAGTAWMMLTLFACGRGEGKPAGGERAATVDGGAAAPPTAKHVVDAAIDALAAPPWHCFKDQGQQFGVCFPGLELCDVARDSYRWQLG